MSRSKSLYRAIAWPLVKDSMNATAVGAFETLSATHDTASGQDFCWSGATGPCSGQQGIPSGMDMDCMSLVPADMRIIAVAPCDAATGATKRPTTARIENRRWKKVRSFTDPRISHVAALREGVSSSHYRQLWSLTVMANS